MSTHAVSSEKSTGFYSMGEKKTSCGIVIRDQRIELSESPTCLICIGRDAGLSMQRSISMSQRSINE